MSESQIDTLMTRAYRTEIRRLGGRVIATSPELGLVAEGDSADAALSSLDDKKRRQFEDFIAADSVDAIPPPGNAPADSGTGISRFVVKSAVVTFCAVLVVFAVNVSFTYTLGAVPLEFTKKFARIGLDRTTAILHQAANTGIVTGARQKQIQQAIRDAVTILKPFSDELSPLFEKALPGCAPAAKPPAGATGS